jgi:hypothetical protein
MYGLFLFFSFHFLSSLIKFVSSKQIYVNSDYTYGHTAMVDSVNGGYVNVVEQNANCGGTNSYSIAGAECFIRS